MNHFNKKQNFVLGFIFNEALTKVLLVKKNRGSKGLDSMKNLLNGIGGHVKENEGFYDAIERECLEETNLKIENWIQFCNLDTKIGKIIYFYSITNEIWNFKQIEDEEIKIFFIKQSSGPMIGHLLKDIEYGWYQYYDRMANLDYLIPMALNHYKKLDNAKLFEIKEIYE